MKRATKALIGVGVGAVLLECGVPALFIGRMELERWNRRRLERP